MRANIVGPPDVATRIRLSIAGARCGISFTKIKAAQYPRAADYVDKILKGASPSELPVEQPIRFEMLVNLKTARALNLELPPSLLAVADEIIE